MPERNIRFLSIMASTIGVVHVAHTFPEVRVYVAAKDAVLNKQCYIEPGLGDAGDQLYGTK